MPWTMPVTLEWKYKLIHCLILFPHLPWETQFYYSYISKEETEVQKAQSFTGRTEPKNQDKFIPNPVLFALHR